MKARFDMPKMERSLRHFAKDFGETSAQAVVRWGVQTSRELAFESLPFGIKASANKKTHKEAIERDLGRVTMVDDIRARRKDSLVIRTPELLSKWLDSNKSGYKNRTKKIPISDRRFVSRRVFNATVRLRMRNIGIAKGGFLGAGMEIAKAQTGAQKINIGKNFLGYAQKHSAFGSAVKPRDGYKPEATLHNRAAHTSKDYVIKRTAINKAVQFGLKKTLQWYSRAIRAIDRKRP